MRKLLGTLLLVLASCASSGIKTDLDSAYAVYEGNTVTGDSVCYMDSLSTAIGD